MEQQGASHGASGEAGAPRDAGASTEAVTTRIGQTAMLLHAGDRQEARSRFGALWEELGASGDAKHRCVLAHYMADAQDDPRDELLWDLRALAAADGRDGAAARAEDGAGRAGAARQSGDTARGGAAGEDHGAGRGAGGQGELPGFHATLHLNLAADYAKLGRPEAARIHLRRASALCDALADDVYGAGVRAAVRRLEARLAGQ